MAVTIWERLDECVHLLAEPFRASEIVAWFGNHYPDVKVQSLRAHIQGATSNASAASRGTFAKREPLVTRVEPGLYRRADGSAVRVLEHREVLRTPVIRRASDEVNIEAAAEKYLRDRDPAARYASFDYCFNHFQQHRTSVAVWGDPVKSRGVV